VGLIAGDTGRVWPAIRVGAGIRVADCFGVCRRHAHGRDLRCRHRRYHGSGPAPGYGRITTAKLREPVYEAVKEFNAEFERRHRTLICRDLLGCDIRTEGGMQAAKERGL
jgi:hypothetical protein